jgi:glutamate transport system substrate-binding protein
MAGEAPGRLARPVWVGLLTTLLILLAGCGPADEPGPSQTAPRRDLKPGSTMARLHDAQRLVVGIKVDQPGFGLREADGRVTGFDAEVAEIIAAELGIPASGIEYVEATPGNREELLERGRVDLVIATYTITAKRKQRVDFAGPYYIAGQQLMVRADDDSISGPETLRGGEKRVCTVEGSTPARNIRRYLADADRQLRLVNGYRLCVEELLAGRTDAVTTDNVILTGFIARNGGRLKLAGERFTRELYGIGVPKGDDDLRRFLNGVIELSYRDGRYQRAWAQTGGKFDDALPQAPAIDPY